MRAKDAVRVEVGMFLRAKREASGLSQMELSRKLKYRTSQFISNWERGISSPPLKMASKLARLLRMEPDELKEIYLRLAIADVEEAFR